jgi:DNA-binding MarR family transcriptional regulator
MTSQQASGIAATDSDDLVDTLVQSAFATMAVLTRIAAEHDLSLTQLRVLAILRNRRPRMTALADYLGLEKSTMSGLVDRAERRGLLERVPGAGDGRAVDVQLSTAGAEIVDRVHDTIREALAPMTSELGPAEQRRLQNLLRRMFPPRSPESAA